MANGTGGNCVYQYRIVGKDRVSPTPPSTLGKYQIIREIARSNDIVYEGYDPQMTRRVAVKELNMPGGATPQQAEDRISRFKREAQAAGRLNHPNIMTVYDVEEDAGHLFMAMEYLDGGTLRAEIDGKGKIEPERAVEIARAVLAGLGHAHAQGVVHRDIKPDNVQILSNGSIKITDFGIARLTFQPNLTMDGQVFGTPSYMSPEQALGQEIDPRSDLFSVGVMLYEMLTGTKPFAGDSVVAITYAIMNREPDSLPETVPYALAEAVRRSLEKTPSLRFDNADAMSIALEDALRPAAPTPSMYDPPVPSTPAPPYSPYGQMPAPPVVNQPYNPYGASGGYTQVPYGQAPYPQAPAPSYAYNPYNQAPYGGPGPTMAPPQTPVPIYYPPPPRQPLLKPETAAFIKKTLVAVIVSGTFVALVLVSVWALMLKISQMHATERAKPVIDSIRNIDPKLPLSDQIAQLRSKRDSLPVGADTTEIDKALVEKYRAEARQASDAGDYRQADSLYAEAVPYGREDPNLLADYGALYWQRAQAMPAGSPEQAELYDHASDLYLQAQQRETDPVQKAKAGNAGARLAVYYAESAIQSDDPALKREARRKLEDAEPYAGDDADLRSRIAGALAQIRG